ncbi:Nitroreductase [Anaerosphaera aminiphila DSM 21120]|uniref:Nitroreductase n=1 Tax=Anaerosphaera aminiphila DSM 21120 TaxID=1120995 RepID=A0A1M5T2T8_9FIRM|nr:nitroreductase family protein [Anaerosphaera aminiphila]SHH45047.1 Nitroreductase [Anaerosphaera aminiphila DSM 21120]
METMKAIATRKSVRKYKPEQISESDLNRILLAGCAAPVGRGNYPGLHITVIQNKDIISKMSDTMKKAMSMDDDPTYGTSTLVVVSSQNAASAGSDYVNTGTVLENMMISAADLGIGSCVIWGSAMVIEADESIKAACEIPEGFSAKCGIALGYSYDELEERVLELKININRI